MTSERIIFIHIPKSAGRTFHSIVARQYDARDILRIEGRLGHTGWSDAEARRAKIIVGLVHYGIHERLPGRTSYATLLRDPIARVLSLYRYIVSNPEHHLHEEVREQGLLRFVSGDIDVEEVENGQTRQIAGILPGQAHEPNWETARSNLVTAFSFVGLVERFDESLILCRRRLGWSMPFYVRKNVTKGSPRDVVTSEVVNTIAERNFQDRRLYEFAKGFLDEQISNESRSFGAEVALFRSLNRGARLYRSLRSKRKRVSPSR